MKALFDEAVPLVGRHYAYVVVATVVVVDDAAMKKDIDVVVGQRKRGFHWANEGPKSRGRMVECLSQMGASGHVAVHHPTGRRGQERARAAAFEHFLPLVMIDGADELLIESRGPKLDARDRAVLLGSLKALGREDVVSEWAGRSNPELWLADAVCGAVSSYLDSSEPGWFAGLQRAGVITEPKYMSGV